MYCSFFFLATIGADRWAKEVMPPKFLAYLGILRFERQCPEQNIVARFKSKYFPPEKIWLGCATACNYFHAYGLHLSHAQPCSSVSSNSHSVHFSTWCSIFH